ncbi:hypothetical protein FHG87_013727 [Trinorchestia longiramus]|nr:hypothetical protein FHG87_013727 [Trinorchestia longiramus]
MDRTQYGLRQPTDAYRPFDIACKTKPLPGYALLADLQSSVPRSAHSTSHSPGPRAHHSPTVTHHHSPTVTHQQSPTTAYTHRSPGPQLPHNWQSRYNSDSNPHYSNGDVDTNPHKYGSDGLDSNVRGAVVVAPPLQAVVVAPPLQAVVVAPPLQAVVVAPPLQAVVVAPPLQAVVVAPPLQAVVVAPPLQLVVVAPPLQAVEGTDGVH